MNFKPRERDKYLTQAEFRQLISWADRQGDPRAALFLFVGGAVGTRIGETRAMLWRDLARLTAERVIEVRCLKKRKRGGGRKEKIADVAIDEKSAERIVGYIAQMGGPGRPDDPVFPGRSGPISHRQALTWAKRAMVGAGLNPNYSYHALRHYRGISLWKASRDIELVKRQLRHENATSTYKYMHMSDEEQRANVEKVEVL